MDNNNTLVLLTSIGVPGLMVGALSYFLRTAFEDVRTSLRELKTGVEKLNTLLSEQNTALRLIEHRVISLEEDIRTEKDAWHKVNSRVQDTILQLARLSDRIPDA